MGGGISQIAVHTKRRMFGHFSRTKKFRNDMGEPMFASGKPRNHQKLSTFSGGETSFQSIGHRLPGYLQLWCMTRDVHQFQANYAAMNTSYWQKMMSQFLWIRPKDDDFPCETLAKVESTVAVWCTTPQRHSEERLLYAANTLWDRGRCLKLLQRPRVVKRRRAAGDDIRATRVNYSNG